MSIFQRKRKTAKNGYIYEVQLYYTYKGIKKRYTKSGFTTKKEAKEHEAEILKQIKTGGQPDKKKIKTLDEVYSEFMNIGSVEYQPTTIYNTERYYKLVGADLGRMSIQDIDYKTLQKWFNGRSNEGIASNQNIKKAISRVFKFAVRCGYIKNNPCSLVVCTGIERHQNREEILSYEDFLTLTGALYNYKGKGKRYTDLFKYKSYSIAIEIGYYTGARISEVLALTKNDVDFENSTISFNKKLQSVGLKSKDFYTMEKMKSKSSKAVLPLADDLKTTLKDWFLVNPYDNIICRENGGFIDPSVMEYDVGAIAKENHIRFFFHMLRHTFATNLVMSGVDLKTAQELMRHANINTTISVYTHISESHKLNTINDVFKKNHVISTLSDGNELKNLN